MSIEDLRKLRAPFPKHQISLLPKPTKRREEMDKLPKGKCAECGGWHATSSVIHLSYVGHAALTDRLLDTDPTWAWEPLSMSPEGLPVMDSLGGMWIKLTVCGVTRLGYGHAGDKEGGDAIKEVIGDALRNAAMRFGAALELWHKGELHGKPEDDDGNAGTASKQKQGDRTLIMKVTNSIKEHLVQGREMGALQEWELARENRTMDTEHFEHGFARAVWAGLTTPEQQQVEALVKASKKDAQSKRPA